MEAALNKQKRTRNDATQDVGSNQRPRLDSTNHDSHHARTLPRITAQGNGSGRPATSNQQNESNAAPLRTTTVTQRKDANPGLSAAQEQAKNTSNLPRQPKILSKAEDLPQVLKAHYLAASQSLPHATHSNPELFLLHCFQTLAEGHYELRTLSIWKRLQACNLQVLRYPKELESRAKKAKATNRSGNLLDAQIYDLFGRLVTALQADQPPQMGEPSRNQRTKAFLCVFLPPLQAVGAAIRTHFMEPSQPMQPHTLSPTITWRYSERVTTMKCKSRPWEEHCRKLAGEDIYRAASVPLGDAIRKRSISSGTVACFGLGGGYTGPGSGYGTNQGNFHRREMLKYLILRDILLGIKELTRGKVCLHMEVSEWITNPTEEYIRQYLLNQTDKGQVVDEIAFKEPWHEIWLKQRETGTLFISLEPRFAFRQLIALSYLPEDLSEWPNMFICRTIDMADYEYHHCTNPGCSDLTSEDYKSCTHPNCKDPNAPEVQILARFYNHYELMKKTSENGLFDLTLYTRKPLEEMERLRKELKLPLVPAESGSQENLSLHVSGSMLRPQIPNVTVQIALESAEPPCLGLLDCYPNQAPAWSLKPELAHQHKPPFSIEEKPKEQRKPENIGQTGFGGLPDIPPQLTRLPKLQAVMSMWSVKLPQRRHDNVQLYISECSISLAKAWGYSHGLFSTTYRDYLIREKIRYLDSQTTYQGTMSRDVQLKSAGQKGVGDKKLQDDEPDPITSRNIFGGEVAAIRCFTHPGFIADGKPHPGGHTKHVLETVLLPAQRLGEAIQIHDVNPLKPVDEHITSLFFRWEPPITVDSLKKDELVTMINAFLIKVSDREEMCTLRSLLSSRQTVKAKKLIYFGLYGAWDSPPRSIKYAKQLDYQFANEIKLAFQAIGASPMMKLFEWPAGVQDTSESHIRAASFETRYDSNSNKTDKTMVNVDRLDIWSHIDKESVVACFNAQLPVRQYLARLALSSNEFPIAIICRTVDKEDRDYFCCPNPGCVDPSSEAFKNCGNKYCKDPNSPEVQDLVENYVEYGLQIRASSNGLHGHSLYVRKDVTIGKLPAPR